MGHATNCRWGWHSLHLKSQQAACMVVHEATKKLLRKGWFPKREGWKAVGCKGMRACSLMNGPEIIHQDPPVLSPPYHTCCTYGSGIFRAKGSVLHT